MRRRCALVFAFVALVTLTNCATNTEGGGGIISVAVNPASVNLGVGNTQLFTATVNGTGTYSNAVSWSATAGTITATGSYTTPAIVPTPNLVTIRATSVADPSKSGSASITVFSVTQVAVSPTSVALDPGATHQFTATVQGVGSVDQSVTWSVNNIPGGMAQYGTITSAGRYSAPMTVPNPDPVSVRATSVADPGHAATSEVTINGVLSIGVTPSMFAIYAGQKQQFEATVNGAGTYNAAVVWSVTDVNGGPAAGSISQSGLYSAPTNAATAAMTDRIFATSVTDPTRSGTADIDIRLSPVLSSITPNQGKVGDVLKVTGDNLFFPLYFVFSGPNGVPIIALEDGADEPHYAQVTVPHSAISGPVYAYATILGGKNSSPPSNTIAFTRVPELRIRAQSRDISSGETTEIYSRVQGDTAQQRVTWSASLGTISSSGVYQAPTVQSDGSFAVVKGCISGTQSCDQLLLGLHPFKITPSVPVVGMGGSIYVDATVGGSPVGATFSQLSGGGSLQPNGFYTAPSNTSDAGGIPIQAIYNGQTQPASIAVTGGFPGAINVVADYIDFSQPAALGTYYERVAVSGKGVFALGSRDGGGYYDRGPQFFVDAFDITDPTHPVWVDSVETGIRGAMFTSNGYLYQIGPSGMGCLSPTIIAAFDVSTPHPVLRARAAVPPLGLFTRTQSSVNALAGTCNVNLPSDQAIIYHFELNSAAISERDMVLTLPSIGTERPFSIGVAEASNRIFVFQTIRNPNDGSLSGTIAAYDMSSDPPALIGSVEGPTFIQPISQFGNLVVADTHLLDLSSGMPVEVGTLPVGMATDVSGDDLLAPTMQTGSFVVDISDPQHPALRSILFNQLTGFPEAQFAGRYVFALDVSGSLLVYDAGPSGGAVFKAYPYGWFVESAAFDELVSQSNLYVAAATDVGSFVPIFDLSTQPIQRLSNISMGTQVAYALQKHNNILYVGTDQALLSIDVTNPANPQQVSSLPAQVSSLASSGNFLYAATFDKQLLAFDVSQPAAPVQVSTQTLPDVPEFVRSSGGLLFVADMGGGLLTYSLLRPGAPALLSQLQPSQGVADVAIDGNLALLAAIDRGLLVVDMANPARPQIIGEGKLPPFEMTTVAQTTSISLSGSIAYLGSANGNGIVYGFDYRRPTYPRLVAMSPLGGMIDTTIITLLVNADDLFVGGYFGSVPLVQLDISRPLNVINVFHPPLVSTAAPTASKQIRLETPVRAKRNWRKPVSLLSTPKEKKSTY